MGVAAWLPRVIPETTACGSLLRIFLLRVEREDCKDQDGKWKEEAEKLSVLASPAEFVGGSQDE